MARHEDDTSRSVTDRTFWFRHANQVLGTSALFILALGTVMYHWLEGWSWIDSLYFSSVAVTTVGFGDLTPTTDASKLFTVVYIFSGVAIIATFLNTRLQRRAAKMNQQGGLATNPERASGGTPDADREDLSGTEPDVPTT